MIFFRILMERYSNIGSKRVKFFHQITHRRAIVSLRILVQGVLDAFHAKTATITATEQLLTTT